MDAVKATPIRYWHDTICITVRWVTRRAHPGSIDIKSEDSILLEESVAYSQCVLKEKAALYTEKV